MSELFSLCKCERQKESEGDGESVQHEFIQLRRVKQGTWENHDFFFLLQGVTLNVMPNSLSRTVRACALAQRPQKKKNIGGNSYASLVLPCRFNAKYWIYERTYICDASPYFTLSASIWKPTTMVYIIRWCCCFSIFDALAFFFFFKTIATKKFIDKNVWARVQCFSFHFRFDSKKQKPFLCDRQKKKCNTI